MGDPVVPAATIHPGAVRAIFDHLILALATEPGAGPSFLFSHYTIRWSDDGVVGELAYVQLERDGVRERLVVTDDVVVAEAHRDRLFPAAWDRTDVAGPPLMARFERSGLGSPIVREMVTGDGLRLLAEWSDLAPPIFAQGPAPAIPTEDIMSTLIDARVGRAFLDGVRVPGEAYPNPAWEAWLGRSMTSCVVAIGEVLLVRS